MDRNLAYWQTVVYLDSVPMSRLDMLARLIGKEHLTQRVIWQMLDGAAVFERDVSGESRDKDGKWTTGGAGGGAGDDSKGDKAAADKDAAKGPGEGGKQPDAGAGGKPKEYTGGEGVIRNAIEEAIGPSKKLTKPDCCVGPVVPSSKQALVGVHGDQVPPPPQDGIPRLPNLTKDQRDVETRYIDAYMADPDKMADKYLRALGKRKVGEYPNVFATDDVKMLNRDWNPDKVRQGEQLTDGSKAAMAQYNAAVHQTANAIAKRAFLKYLDDTVAKYPEGDPRRSVLATNGGCAAGKGSTLSGTTDKKNPHYGMLPAADQVGAIWDAAGEQNATENEWIYRECQKRGIKATFAYVWADPKDTWDASDRGVVRRAMRKGRMVDAGLFTLSYTEGAKNMHSFWESHRDKPGASFVFIDNRAKGAPKVIDSFPKETLSWDPQKIYTSAIAGLLSRKDDLSKELLKGGLNGHTIWGPPKAAA